MKLYLDEDMTSALLVKLLKHAGHDVGIPADVGMMGKSDAEQLTHAVRGNRAILSYNYGDFEHLHILVRGTQGHHCGILIVRREDDTRKNMSPILFVP